MRANVGILVGAMSRKLNLQPNLNFVKVTIILVVDPLRFA